MQDFAEAFRLAARLVLSGDPTLMEIIALSLRVSLSALAIAVLVGLPAGAFLAIARFAGRNALLVVLNALMGLPPVVLGLLVYLALSRAGPLGALGLLYTPTAMIIAQSLLITPIIAALSRQVIEDLDREYGEQFRSLCLSPYRRIAVLVREGRLALTTVALAGFGRAIAEVGAVIIVGGNIAHVTRVMTTAIALETAKGELALALALGLVLMTIALLVNGAVMAIRLGTGDERHA